MNVFELFAKIDADTSGFESGLSKAKDLGKNVLGGIGNIAKVGFGAATAAVAAGTAAVGAFGAQAVKSYANYEQLVGGVDKLYGTASKKLQEYADKAYLSAGMSANAYMETATSFSAALIKSLDGDVDKAADMTDKAMRAMSDNVNVFGSDMASVQNAYQGFAKQNYTMLDNLKLGYGGTKEEMQKLIADANEYRASIGETSDLTIESFADIVTAIDSIQQKQKIQGATQAEAMKTLEGSANATKAAWENVITAIGRGEGIGDAFKGLTTALFGENEGEGLLNQVIPRIQTTLEGIGDFIGQASPIISEKVPELVNAVLPSLVDGGISLAGALGEGIISALPALGETIIGAAGTLGSAFLDMLDVAASATAEFDFAGTAQTISDKMVSFFTGDGVQRFVESAFKLIGGLVSGIGQALPSLIPAAVQIIYSLGNTLWQNVPTLIDAGLQLIVGLAQGIVNAIPVAVEGITTCWLTIFNVYGTYGGKILDKVKDIFSKVVTTVVTFMQKLPERIAYFAGYAVGKFVDAITKLPDKAKELFDKVVTKVKDFGTKFVEVAPQTAKDFAEKLVDGIKDLPSKMFEWGAKIVQGLIDGVKSLWDGFTSLLSSAKQGMDDARSSSESAGNAPKSINSAFNPSNLFSDNTITDNNGFSTEEIGITYDALANAVVKAFTAAGITVECDSREFGRLVRKAVTA